MDDVKNNTNILDSIITLLNNDSEASINRSPTLDEIEASIKAYKDKMHQEEVLSKHSSPITLLPSGYYYTRVHGRKIQRRNLDDLKMAIVDCYDGKYKEKTLVTIFDAFLNSRKMEVSDRTWKKDLYNFETYIKNSKLGNMPIKKINLDDGYKFLAECKDQYPQMKKKYWEGIRGTLNNLIMYAITRGLIKTNPFEHLRPKKDFFEPDAKIKDKDTVFSNAEQMAVTDLAEKDSEITHKAEPLGIIILFNLGLRDGELCALKWRDIEELHGKAYIHIQREMVANINEDGKSNGFKVLPHCKTEAGDRRLQLNDKAIDTFNLIKSLNIDNDLPVSDDDYIFQRRYKGEVTFCTPRSFDPRLRKYCTHAGMEVIKSPHDVRRTVLTNLYYAGMPFKKIQEYAGHSSLKQTMDYIRITDDDIDMGQYLNTLSTSNNIISFTRQKSVNKKSS